MEYSQKNLQWKEMASEVVEDIRSETELQTILQKMVTVLGQFTKADRCTIWLYDSDKKEFLIPQSEYRSSHKVKKIAHTVFPSTPVLPEGLGYEEVIRVPDISKWKTSTERDKQIILDREIVSLVHVPIAYGEKLLGVLRIHAATERPDWDEETVSIVKKVAAHVSIAVHKALIMQQLKESDARKTAILESSLDAIVSMDHLGNVVDWNGAAERLFGYKRADAVGRNMGELIIPERYRERHTKGLARYLATGEEAVINQLIEIEALRADGTEFLSELTITSNSAPGPPFFTGTLRDITARKQAEQALRESEDRFRTLADNIQNLAWMSDANGRIFWYNQRWYEFTGTTLEEMHDGGWKKIHHPDHVKRINEFVRQAWQKNDPWELTFPLRDLHGQYRWFLTRANPLRNAAGKIIQWIGTSTDIHEQKVALEKKDEFLSIASHELKTPLTSVKASIQIIERQLHEKSFDTMEKFLNKANDQVTKLTGLVDDLLDVSTLQAGKLHFNYSRFSASRLVADCVEQITPQLTHHEIITHIEPNLMISADKNRLEQVINNLLSNAVKYSPKAGQVILEAKKERSFLEVSVTDFGIGIPLEKQPFVFDRFYRAQEAAHQFQGLGLGLYISNQIVERHKGKMWVRSEEGTGSTFIFKIPLAGNKRIVK